jgi:signal transduction histidine kinase
LDEALGYVLRRLCEQNGWSFGQVLRPTPGGRELTVVECCHARVPDRFAAFRSASQALRFGPGSGLPGRVLSSGQLAWTTRLGQDLLAPRAALAQELGLRTALVLPVMAGPQVVAVLEFFSDREIPADERMLTAMSSIGLQLGLVMVREQAEERLRQAERLVAMGTFAAGIAHEVNNPLTAILLAARHALMGNRKPATLRIALGEIVADAQRCARIVRGVLRFARQEPSEKAPEDLNEIVHQARRLTSDLAHRRHVGVRLELAKDLPTVAANRTDIEQALVDVINNAIEASAAGQEVVVRTETAPDAVRVRVQDRGTGMPAEVKDRAFDPFFTTRASEHGTGLGLSMAHGIIAEHGGWITIDSQPGEGTLVTVELRAAPFSADVGGDHEQAG